MIFSMTGYAVKTLDIECGTLQLEFKSVNSRYLDFHFRIAEDLRISWRLAHKWFVVVVVRNVAGARSGKAARQDAGPMVARVVGALVGAGVPGATQPLTLVTPPPATYRAGHQYIPSAFEVETIFRKPQNP